MELCDIVDETFILWRAVNVVIIVDFGSAPTDYICHLVDARDCCV